MKGKKSFWVAGALVVLMGIGGAWSTLSAQGFQYQPGPPPGVAAGNWVQISGGFGFVVQRQLNTHELTGYFMLKRGGTWWRVTRAPRTEPLALKGG